MNTCGCNLQKPACIAGTLLFNDVLLAATDIVEALNANASFDVVEAHYKHYLDMRHAYFVHAGLISNGRVPEP